MSMNFTGGCPFHRLIGAVPTRSDVPVDPSLAALPAATTAPMVSGLPVLGSGLQLLRDPYGWWPQQMATHGSVFRVNLPTDRKPWIVLAGEKANELLAKEGRRLFSQAMTYPKAEAVLKTTMHPSITEGDTQRHLRGQIAPAFSRQAAAPHLRRMLQEARQIVGELESGTDMNVTEWTSRLGLQSMAIFATGRPLDGSVDDIRRYATAFTGTIAMNWPLALMSWGSVGRTREALDRMIEERLEEHRRTPPGAERAPDYFDAVLAGTLPDGTPFPDRVKVVYGQIPFKNMGVYAGRVLNHLLYDLVSRPEVLQRVLPEIDRVLGADDITLDDLNSMVAFRAALSETLRVRPIAVSVQRTVVEPFAFEGYRFAPGDKLFFAISATHAMAEHFEDPERYDIDRFIGADPPRYVYNPFGVGHHSCMARGLFEVIALLTVGTMLRRWRLHADYTLRSIVDALPGPWPFHRMRVVGPRVPATVQDSVAELPSPPQAWAERIGEVAPVSLEANERLFCEGDDSDRMYVIVSGELDVMRGGSTIATLTAGQVVGEIGLLHDVRRTATVVARQPSRLLAVEAAAFASAAVELDLTARQISTLARQRHACSTLSAALQTTVVPSLVEGRVDTVEAGPGARLVTEGEEADAAYLLVEGEVEVQLGDATLHTLRAPDLFGEISLLHGGVRTASVVAGSDGARLLRVDRSAFSALLAQPCVEPELRYLSARRALETSRL